MEENTKITKIVVSKEDEITDIVSGILGAQTERVIITFAEESDLLISTINLTVLQETAEEEGKILICQIIKNPTGLRNANLAGIVTIDSPNNPTDDMWDKAKTQKEEKLTPKTKKEEDLIQEVEPPVQTDSKPSNFEKRINDAIQKSKLERETHQETKAIKQDGLVISVGEDLPVEESSTKEDEFIDLSKIDFKDVSEKEIPKQNKFHFKFPQIFKPKATTDRKPNSPVYSKFRKLWPIFLFSFVLVVALVAFIYFSTVPFVKVRIFVKAQEVSIEKTFTGDSNIKEIDFTNLKIPLKSENLETSRSSTVTATGKAYKGEKAKGSVTFTYAKSDCTGFSPINLPANQVITSSDGKAYALDTATTMACSSMATVAVHAVEIGEEFNTSNSYFTVKGNPDIFGIREGLSFSGGTKEQYTVLSLTDVNTAVDDLKASAITEAEQTLKGKEGEWVMIANTLKSEVKPESIKTDIAVGAAANQANVSMTVTSSATYYLSNGFDRGIANLLTEEAKAKNLFQTDQNIELVLSDSIQKEISVVQNTDSSVLVKLTATGSVQPKVDKEKITTDLKGMNWKEGSKYLDGIKYSDKATLYEFNPVNFPKSFYYFPKRQGGILIEVADI